jgi:DNA (cytosine-5)-methyltransferase 1
MELVCVNHWQTAIDTHTLNHPKARHFVQDIATVRPHILVPEGYLDLLMASPTCTHHSNARGGKPTSDQQRSDPWHIITWLTELRVTRLIIENVWEFTSWGPVDPKTGKPIQARKGEYFNAWIDTLRRLGFDPEWRKLNAADYGDATTRQRFILMARSDGKRIRYPTPTHMRRPDEGLALFPTVQPWRPAREIIDWNLKGRSILNRKKPLAPKTLARIYAGATKHNWPEPYLVILRNHMAAQGLDLPVPAIAAQGTHIGLAQPIALNMKKGATARDMDAPLFAQTAEASHVALAEPVIMNGRKGNQAKGVSAAPVPTLDTKGGVWLAEPLVLSQHSSGVARTSADPLPTITTGGAGAVEHPDCARPMLVEPFITTVAHGNSPGDATADTRRVSSVDNPLGALTAGGGQFAVVEPFILSQASGGVARQTSSPVPSITTDGAHALISPYYGSGSGETCTTDQVPLPTLTAVARFGVVVPVTNKNGGPGPRSTNEPLPTMTTAKGGEFAMVMPVTHHDTSSRARDVDQEPIPTATGANRGELAFVTAQFGEREGQGPRTHDLVQPAPTGLTLGKGGLVEGVVEAVEGLEGYDILFRMLEPHELAAAMGFTSEDQEYEFAGTKTDQIKQIGNAVSVAKMKACVGAIMADAVPRRRAAKATAAAPVHAVATEAA